MRGLKSVAHAKRFLSIFGLVADLFGVSRHLLSARKLSGGIEPPVH